MDVHLPRAVTTALRLRGIESPRRSRMEPIRSATICFSGESLLHGGPHTLECMEVQFTPELEQQLLDLAAATGRSADELVLDATVG